MLQWLQLGFDQLHLDIVGLSVSLDSSHVLALRLQRSFMLLTLNSFLVSPSLGKLL